MNRAAGAVYLLGPVSTSSYCCLSLLPYRDPKKDRDHSIITFPMMLPTSCREKEIEKDDVTAL